MAKVRNASIRPGILLLSGVLLFLSSCRVAAISTPAVTLESVVIEPGAPSMAPGTTLQLQAFAISSNNSRINVTQQATWASANVGVATADARGVVTSLGPGSSTITATFQNVAGSAVAAVSPLVSLSLSPADATIAGGTTLQFTAFGLLQNGQVQDVTTFAAWRSSDTGIAAVSNAGLATAATSATGTTMISATVTGVTGTAALTTAAVLSISVSPSSVAISLGARQQFSASASLQGGATQTITDFAVWSSSTPSVAVIGNTAGAHGLAVSESAGSAEITASFGGCRPCRP